MPPRLFLAVHPLVTGSRSFGEGPWVQGLASMLSMLNPIARRESGMALPAREPPPAPASPDRARPHNGQNISSTETSCGVIRCSAEKRMASCSEARLASSP